MSLIRVASLFVVALAISMPSELNCRRLKLVRRGDSEMNGIIVKVPDSKIANTEESHEKMKIDSRIDLSKEKFEQSSMSFESSEEFKQPSMPFESSEELKKVKIPIKIVEAKSSEEKIVLFKRGAFEEKKPFLEVKKVPVKVEVKVPVKEEVKVPVEELKKVIFKRGISFGEKKPFIDSKKVQFKEDVKIPFVEKVKVPVKQMKKVFFKRGILEKKIITPIVIKEKTKF